MVEPSVIITIVCKAKSGQEVRLRGILEELMASSREEEGCMEYRVHESLIDPLDFMLYMRWRDDGSFQRHVYSPHVKKFDEVYASELLEEPYKLTRWVSL